MLITSVSLFWICGHYCYQQLPTLFSQNLNFDKHILYNSHLLPKLVLETIKIGLNALLPIMAGLVLIAFVALSLFGGIYINHKSIKFDWKKLNPINGLKRLFSINTLADIFKALLKVVLVAIGISLFLWVNLADFFSFSHPTLLVGIKSGDAINDICYLYWHFYAYSTRQL